MTATSQNSKNIVLLSGFRIFPSNTGGHVHTSGIARSLARMGHRVLIYSLAGRRGDYGAAPSWGARFHSQQIEPNLIEETNLNLGFGLVQAATRRLDYPRIWQHRLLSRGIVPRRLGQALEHANLILSDMPWCPRVPGSWSKKPWFMISHNLEYQLLEQANGKYKAYAPWMHGIEARAPQEFTDIFPCAQSDHDFFRAHDPTKSLKLPIIGCGVDREAYRVAPQSRDELRKQLGVAAEDKLIVFSGSNYAPNVEALAQLRDFCRAHAEALARDRIYILALGSVSSAPWREGRMIATGRVPEVAPYFAAADAGLNPITRGSGANVKLFEYLATGLPVISTLFGVRGTDLQAAQDYLAYEGAGLLDAVHEFATARSALEWQAFAAEVWARHLRTCDIQAIVGDAIAQRPEFAA